MPGNGWKDEGTSTALQKFHNTMWICIHIFIIFICTYVDADTCETCFHCQSSLNPGSLMGCALVADFLPGRIEVGQWGLKNFRGEWWSPGSGGTAMNVGRLLLMHHVIIPTDQAAALVTIGEIYSMNGKKDEAKKVRLIFFCRDRQNMLPCSAVWACMVN